MKDLKMSAWNKFEKSGKISDYLNYKSFREGEVVDSQNSRDCFGAVCPQYTGQDTHDPHL